MGVRNLAGFNKKIEDAAANGKQIIDQTIVLSRKITF